MHSRRLESALTKLVESAASHLQAEIDSGAEVPFELGSQKGRRARGGTPLYCYRALTGAFIAERASELERLNGYSPAAKALEGFEGLDRYLASIGPDRRPIRPTKGSPRTATAIVAVLADVFDEQTEFEVHPERLSAALGRLERSAITSPGEMTLVATLHGLTITSAELSLTKGLMIAHPDALEGIPAGVGSTGDGAWAEDHLVVVLTVADEEGAGGQVDSRKLLARARAVLSELLGALRLFGDGRVALGALAWAQIGGGSFSPLALAGGGRPHGMLVVTAEQEDELRAFCNLVSRRAPHRNELAWALARFELGCGRESPYEALSDYLLALRALLEPDDRSSGLLAPRLAALCATPENRAELTERIVAAVELERLVISGASPKHAGAEALVTELADHLRALLRDVICGHLTPDLRGLADELLVGPEDSEEGESPPTGNDAGAGPDEALEPVGA